MFHCNVLGTLRVLRDFVTKLLMHVTKHWT